MLPESFLQNNENEFLTTSILNNNNNNNISAVAVDGLPLRAPPPPSSSSLIVKTKFYCTQAVEQIRQRWSLVRPWREFFDRQTFSPPSNLSDSLNRINRNVNQYYHNYIITALLCSSYVLLINPVFSISMMFIMGIWWYVTMKQNEGLETNCNYLSFGDFRITFSQAYLAIFILGVFFFFFTGGSSVVFWLLFSSFGSVLLHAVMRKPPREEPLSIV